MRYVAGHADQLKHPAGKTTPLLSEVLKEPMPVTQRKFPQPTPKDVPLCVALRRIRARNSL